MIAKCILCGESYAEVSIEGVDKSIVGERSTVHHAIAPLRYPISGAMFGSPDPAHGVEPPFDPILDFEFMRCPFGRTHRPMVTPDLILTNKGMVRLPKDGSPAFMDPDAKAEVDRESIGDRVVQVSDEEAERQARNGLAEKVQRKVESEAAQQAWDAPFKMDTIKENLAPLTILEANDAAQEAADKKFGPVFTCPECGASFGTERAMKGHIGGAHRKAKVPEKKAKGKGKK